MEYGIMNLCNDIGLQSEIKNEVLNIYGGLDFDGYKDCIEGLTGKERPLESFIALSKSIKDDVTGLKLFTVYLECARLCYKTYADRGIAKRIYVDTMTAFRRFAEDYRQKNGKYGFDCGWWAYRHINLSLFNLGGIEFEYEESKYGKVINMHFPAGCSIKPEDIKAGTDKCKAFTEKYFPDYSDVKFATHSWLLSPVLTPLLNENSNIANFAKLFEIKEVYPEENQYIGFLFGVNPDTPVNELAEKTSLQRKVKELIKSGGSVGAAYGFYKN